MLFRREGKPERERYFTSVLTDGKAGILLWCSELVQQSLEEGVDMEAEGNEYNSREVLPLH